mgnify:CR=1 FL=1
MNVTTRIPCGNGRILRADAGAIEVELIAYSKGARYGCFRISGITESRDQLVILRPARHFGLQTFPYKRYSRLSVRYGGEGEAWETVPEEALERTPEALRAVIPLRAGVVCDLSTEAPHEYAITTAELTALAREHREIAELHSPGASVEGRPLFVLRVTARANRCGPGEETRPVIHIVCGEHATEFAGEEIGRGMLSLALDDTAEARTLRDTFVFDFILNANPDGNFHGWHQYNANDWRAHNYSDGKDRSWHHEFVPYLLEEPGVYSPETVALMSWLRRTRPALYISLHSWEGHDGQAGAFHAAPETLSPVMQTLVDTMNAHAIAAAEELGKVFAPRPSRQSERHLGELLMAKEICPAYLPEGHVNWGQARLRRFGRSFLTRLLTDEKLALDQYDPCRWETVSASTQPLHALV